MYTTVALNFEIVPFLTESSTSICKLAYTDYEVASSLNPSLLTGIIVTYLFYTKSLIIHERCFPPNNSWTLFCAFINEADSLFAIGISVYLYLFPFTST